MVAHTHGAPADNMHKKKHQKSGLCSVGLCASFQRIPAEVFLLELAGCLGNILQGVCVCVDVDQTPSQQAGLFNFPPQTIIYMSSPKRTLAESWSFLSSGQMNSLDFWLH